MRCLTLADYAYNPARITKCMKRDPKFRGQADKWEVISYDEALDIVFNEYGVAPLVNGMSNKASRSRASSTRRSALDDCESRTRPAPPHRYNGVKTLD